MSDLSPIKDFKCRRCGEVLCQTDGKMIRVEFEGNTIAEVWAGAVRFDCGTCQAVNVWKRSKKMVRSEIFAPDQ